MSPDLERRARLQARRRIRQLVLLRQGEMRPDPSVPPLAPSVARPAPGRARRSPPEPPVHR